MLRWWIETHSFKHGRTRSWLAVNFQIFARTYQTLSSEVASLTSQNILKICHIFQNVRSCSSRALSENSDTKADSSEGRRMRARSTSSLNCNPHMLLLLLDSTRLDIRIRAAEAAAEAAAAQAAGDAEAQAAAYAAIKRSRSPRFQRSLNAPIRFSHINLGRPIQPTAMSYSQSRRKSTRRRKNRSRRRRKRSI